MKRYFVLAFLVFKSMISFSQLSYDELLDLNVLCKKEDFEAVKTFLTYKDYSITLFRTNYDHGSYFVVAEIEARTKVGERNDYPQSNEYNNIYDEIKIDFKEYDKQKELSVTQKISTNKEYFVKYRKLAPVNAWKLENWTRLLIDDYDFWKDVYPKKNDSINNLVAKLNKNNKDDNLYGAYLLMGTGSIELGARSYDVIANGYDNDLPKISNELVREMFSKHTFKENENFSMNFYNDNPTLGDLKNYYIQFSPSILDSSYLNNSYYLHVTLQTRFVKGDNIQNQSKRILKFPLIKRGQSYLIKVKFGSIIKTYVLDSGASDMTIDKETLNYFSKNGKMKVENRLTDANYQLADGSIVRYKRVRIPSFSISEANVENITATIVENGKPLLLGKSFLDIFKTWKIDNNKQVLVVELF